MNPPCAKCKKTVYPVEKLNCLDHYWHKACFRCEVCQLKLTMKNYKGYNKKPYCNAHYPTTRFTAVADTPEALRLAKQQKNISEVEYRKDKIDSMKAFTQVSDSVANRQASNAYKLASTVGYHTAPHEVGHEGEKPNPENIVNRRQPAGGAPPPQQQPQQQYQPPPPQQQKYQQPPPQQQKYQQPPPPQPTPVSTPAQVRYVAIFDYTAGDDDEISITEGDEIVEVTVIDEGWMEGRNSSTGKYGMFPSNYVEKK